MTKKIEFGDFQTPLILAQEVTGFLGTLYPEAFDILEPTCGQGSFIHASMNQWGKSCEYYGFDINEEYVDSLKKELGGNANCYFEVSDFFTKKWRDFFATKPEWLIIGNPPWVTNSALASLDSQNLPSKSNFQQHKGFAAKTGKANFDIAEWMLIKLIESLGNSSACLAMLCKTATARKVLRYFWNKNACISNTSVHKIDAGKYFGVAVDACLFVTFVGNGKKSKNAKIYSDLSFKNKIGHMGLVKDELVADIDLYEEYKFIDGCNVYGWRSGIKHDAAKVMELKKVDETYVNGFGESCVLENEYLFPLLKSSDIANQRLHPRRYVIITQQRVGDDTESISMYAPKTWAYLERYVNKLDARKSMIYKNRPRFSIFGVGDYSFAPWKVVISGMYKNCMFSVVGQKDGKPIMVDDTNYFLPCSSEKEAILTCCLLNSEPCQKFIKSLFFVDAKRPVTLDLLKRINLSTLAKTLGEDEFDEIFFSSRAGGQNMSESLLFS